MNYMIAPGVENSFKSIMLTDRIQILICDYFNVSIYDVRSRSRERHVATSRHFIHYFLRSKTSMTAKMIGWTTKRDHSTVLHSVKVIRDCQIYSEFKTDKVVIELRINELLEEEEMKANKIISKRNYTV